MNEVQTTQLPEHTDDIEALAKELWAVQRRHRSCIEPWEDAGSNQRQLMRQLVIDLVSDESSQIRLRRMLGVPPAQVVPKIVPRLSEAEIARAVRRTGLLAEHRQRLADEAVAKAVQAAREAASEAANTRFTLRPLIFKGTYSIAMRELLVDMFNAGYNLGQEGSGAGGEK